MAGTAAFLAWAVRGKSASVLAPSVWRGAADRKTIALTFDDGPSEGTPRVLEALEKHGVVATFFQCGANVERLPAVAKEVRAAGHEIGNHSQTHPLFCFRSPGFMEEEIRRAQESIAVHTGDAPAWFRAPFGVRWFGLGGAQRRAGVAGVMWTLIGYDWKRKAEAVAAHVVSRVGNGAIICLHDGRELRAKPDIGETVEAVQRLVPVLLDRGYRFETVSRLLCPTNSCNAS